MSKNFVAWDGEGRNNDYFLLQNSEGLQLQSDKMSNKCRKCPCLCIHDVLYSLYANRSFDTVNVWYRARYDWDSLFKYCPRQERLDYVHGQVIINGYTIQVTPNKMMRIANNSNRTNWHYDVFSFFQCSFLEALKDWKIPIPSIIERGKKERDSFETWKDEEIAFYNSTECKLLVEMMSLLEDRLLSVKELIGGEITSWHGPGAIARVMLDSWKARSYCKAPITDIKKMTLASYYGGRSELLKRGEYFDVHNYDINSAYPSATRELPNFAKATWKHVSGNEALDYEFGLSNVFWTDENSLRDNMGPFPFRCDGEELTKNTLVYPLSGKGTYHLVEIKEALKKRLWDIVLGDSWVLDNGYEKPFYDRMNNLMTQRLKLKKAKDFGHKPLKLGANSFYGKFAEIYDASYRGKANFGVYNNMLWASFITAWTRAQLMKYVKDSDVILMATDGLYSLSKLDCPIGEDLGTWEYTHYDRARFILPGIYNIDGATKKRGYPNFDFDQIYNQVIAGKIPKLTDRMFVSVRKSLVQYKKFPVCGFYDMMKEIDWNSPKRIWQGNSSKSPNIYQEESLPFEPFRPQEHTAQETLDMWSDSYEA